MKLSELNPYSFKALRHRLGHDRPRDLRPMWQVRLSADSDFCRAMVGCGYLTREQMLQAVQRYRLGRSRDGGVIFWQIDTLGQICDGKIMHYRPDGHRDHLRKPTWVSYLLKRNGLLPEEFMSEHSLFGTHLLKTENVQSSIFNLQYPVAVVEAEKTAVIMSARRPDVLWLAAGGLSELTAVKLFPLRGRRIILFPDTDPDGQAYAAWYKVMLEAQHLLGQTIHLSPLLEQKATPDQKQRKIDIADLLLENQ